MSRDDGGVAADRLADQGIIATYSQDKDKIAHRNAKLSTKLNRAQLLLMDPRAYGLFTHLEKVGDIGEDAVPP